MENVPLEVFQHILETGCDLEFEEFPHLENHTRSRRLYFRGHVRSQRYLKPFARSSLGVCKDWKKLIDQTSSLWVTTLINTSAMVTETPLEIFGKTQVDLIVSLTLETYEESSEWFKTQILPFSHRFRKLLIYFTNVRSIPQFLSLLCKARFPRLLGLTLKFSDLHFVGLDLPDIWAPKVRSLNISRIPWDPNRNSFRDLVGLEMLQDVGIGIPHDFWDPAISLKEFLSPSSQTLVSLTIALSHNSRIMDTENIVLQLHRLTRLYIIVPSLGLIFQILEMIVAPILKNLTLKTTALRVEGLTLANALVNQMPFRELDFSTVRYIGTEMPVNCLHQVFWRLSVPNVEGLVMRVSNLQPHDFVMTEHPSFPLDWKQSFDNLRAFHLNWKTVYRGTAEHECLRYLFDRFDFSHTWEHASVSLNSSIMTSRLSFPNLKQYSTISLRDLKHITAPALDHLYLPLADLQNGHPWIDACDVSDIPLQKITTLNVGMMIFLDHIRDLEARIFAPFTAVTTLVVSHFYNFMASSNVEYSWPICWKAAPSGWRLFGSDNTVFPKLVTLQVALPEEDVRESVLEKMVDEIEDFIQARKKHGFPIRAFLVNYIPPSLFAKITEIGRGVEEFRIVPYNHEEEMKWLTTIRMWPM